MHSASAIIARNRIAHLKDLMHDCPPEDRARLAGHVRMERDRLKREARRERRMATAS